MAARGVRDRGGAQVAAVPPAGHIHASSRAAPEPDPRADELRQRIAEAREVVDERDTFEEAEVTIDEAPDPASRRRDVHDRGRAALDRMRGESPPE